MRYREKRYDCGEYMEVEVFALPPDTKPLKRAKREKESTPKRKQLNDSRSIKQFVRLANTNFHKGDFAVELTFNRHNLPGSPEELAKEVANYLRRVKYAMGPEGAELKFMYALSEKGKDGRKVRPHVHMLVAGVSREILASKWGKGYVNIDDLQPDENGIEGKARYIAKQADAGAKRWVGSRNLQKPEVITSDKAVTSSEADRMHRYPEDREFFEKKYNRGKNDHWTFTECTSSIIDYDGSYYISIKLRKEEKQNEKRRNQRKPKKSIRNQNKATRSQSKHTGPPGHGKR